SLVEHGAGNKHAPGSVDAVHDLAIVLVHAMGVFARLAAIPEAHHAKRHRGDDFKTALRISFYQRGKIFGPLDVLAQHGLDAVAAEVAQHKPELERAEAVAERHAVIHQIVGTRVGLGL